MALFHLCDLGEQLWPHCFFLSQFLLLHCCGTVQCICLISTAFYCPILHKEVLDTVDKALARLQRALCWGREGSFLLLLCVWGRSCSSPFPPEQRWSRDPGILPPELSRNSRENNCRKLLEGLKSIWELDKVKSAFHCVKEHIQSGLNLEVMSVSAFMLWSLHYGLHHLDVETKSCSHLFYLPLQCLCYWMLSLGTHAVNCVEYLLCS